MVKETTTADAAARHLLASLRERGFAVYIREDGKLGVSHGGKLTTEDEQAIRASKPGLLELLREEEAGQMKKQPTAAPVIPAASQSPPVATQPVSLPLAKIRTDGGTQPRAGMDDEVLSRYQEALEAGATFPPVVVFHDGQDHWLADGFHRHETHKRAGRDSIPADVRQGTRRDAVLFSVGANATHGEPRSPDDQQRAVQTLLADREWSEWNDSEIARCCHVSHTYVGKLRRKMQPPKPTPSLPTVGSEGEDPAILQPLQDTPAPQAERKVNRKGKTYTMKTGGIGKKPRAQPKPKEDEDVTPAKPPSKPLAQPRPSTAPEPVSAPAASRGAQEATTAMSAERLAAARQVLASLDKRGLWVDVAGEKAQVRGRKKNKATKADLAAVKEHEQAILTVLFADATPREIDDYLYRLVEGIRAAHREISNVRGAISNVRRVLTEVQKRLPPREYVDWLKTNFKPPDESCVRAKVEQLPAEVEQLPAEVEQLPAEVEHFLAYLDEVQRQAEESAA